MRYLYCILLLWLPFYGYAQDDVFDKANKRVRGLVHTMKITRNMVHMDEDSIADGKLIGENRLGFNENGTLAIDTAMTKLTHDTFYIFYTYDVEGILINTKGRNNDSVVVYKLDVDYKYAGGMLTETNDAAGLKVSYSYFKDSTIVIAASKSYKNKYAYFYDDKHKNITRINSYVEGRVTSWMTYEYDAFDNPVKRHVYNPGGKLYAEYTYEYIYDAHHNFTQRTEFRNGQPYTRTRRMIRYQ